MLNPILAMLLPPLMLVPAMGLLSSIASRSRIETEVRRKSLHICIGFVSLTFPLLLTEPWMVITTAALAFMWMLAVRRLPVIRRHFGGVLHDTDRVSLGELYFVASIGALLLASEGTAILYVVPILILTLADAFAAVVGRTYPLMPLRGPAKGKTGAGSAVFFITAFLVTLPALSAWTDYSFLAALAIAFTVAVATCIAEAISSKGFDNLAVPTVALFILKLFVVGV